MDTNEAVITLMKKQEALAYERQSLIQKRKELEVVETRLKEIWEEEGRLLTAIEVVSQL